MNVLQEDCDLAAAEDKSLPYTAYLVTYEVNGMVKHDIAMGSKEVEIFDYYWDKYRIVLGMKQTEGRISPKMWNPKKTK
tara:strand:+ start:224 stop:460 length:237 start_codon:yes stop_codon:yes gene_type:complete